MYHPNPNDRNAAHFFGLDTSHAHGAIADYRLTLGVLRGMAETELSEGTAE